MAKNLFCGVNLVGFLLSVSCLAGGAETTTRDVKCASLLTHSDQIARMRAEILASNLSDRKSARPGAKSSNFIEKRAKEIESSSPTDSHVVSLGSGPDIYLPLYLYPTAKYFHLVDLLNGWGNGPDHIVGEIHARLQSLSPDVVVERTDLLGHWPTGQGRLPEPLVWRVRWRSPTSGFQEKFFFLHQLDFKKSDELKNLMTFFSTPPDSAGLGGIVITGISASLETRRLLLAELQSGGSMFTEMLYVNDDGQTSSPADQSILNDLASVYEVRDLGRTNMGFLFNPHQFLISPRR